jgi:hypothetical protein
MTARLTILIIVFISFYGQGAGQSKQLNNYTLKVEKIGTVNDKGKTFLVVMTTLTNHSEDTLKYNSDSCSWQDYYSVNETNLQVETALCDKYIPIVLTLAPGQSRQVELRLLSKRRTTVSQMKFKVGFHLLLDRVYTDDNEVSEEFRKNVIWSNEISM